VTRIGAFDYGPSTFTSRKKCRQPY
jgi:hypothetical protein